MLNYLKKIENNEIMSVNSMGMKQEADKKTLKTNSNKIMKI